MQAAVNLDHSIIPKETTDTSNTLFIHWTHHPHGIHRASIRQIYKQTLQLNDTHDRMVVAMSHPKNLRDILTKTKLSLPNGMTVQDFIAKILYD
jgi:hypothetical protein